MTAYDKAFDQGYKDAQAGKPRKSKPSFWKGLAKPSYLDDHAKGYRNGFDAGLRERRFEVLRETRNLKVRQSKRNFENNR